MILSSEEKIKRIEMAPKEVQAMVAKAFIREDIDDEGVQYLFNEDTLEELNDPEDNALIENINAEEEEGIGAGEFTMRTRKPSKNKNFIRDDDGGWNTCIKGSPTDKNANVLANCVGYASGRFNEIINEARGTAKCTYKTLNSNAEVFIERAQKAGLKTGSTPRVGAIMCWRKGKAGNGSDGAGHVAIVEKVYNNNKVYTSESGWGSSTAFWNQTRTNSNGKWGMGSSYAFRAFIYLPDDVQKIVDESLKPKDDKDEEDKKPTPAPTPKPSNNNTLKVGDKVKIVDTGNGSSYGTSNTAYGIGWKREILQIYKDRKYPYRVGNDKGTTGFYKASALKKL